MYWSVYSKMKFLIFLFLTWVSALFYVSFISHSRSFSFGMLMTNEHEQAAMCCWTGKSPTKWFIWIKKKRNVERSFPCTWNICPVIMRTLLISILLLHSIIINTQTRFLSSTHHIQFYALQLSQATNNFEQHKYWMDVTFGQWQWMCFACYLYKAAHSTNQTASIKQANVAWYECTYKRMSVLFVDLLYAKRVCVPYRPLHPASNMV